MFSAIYSLTKQTQPWRSCAGGEVWCWCRYKDLAALNGEVGAAALALYCATVRATLFVCKGYECQEKEGVFMTAFPGPIKALEWAVTLQMALLRSAIPSAALHDAT